MIGVSESCDEDRVRVTRTYVDAVLAAGGIPVVIPLMRDTACLSRLFERLDGLVLEEATSIRPVSMRSPPLRWGMSTRFATHTISRCLTLLCVGIFPCWAFAAASS